MAVHQLKYTSHPDLDPSLLMNIVRDRMHDWDVKALSIRSGLSTAALYALRSGRTRWPRDTSLRALLPLLGLELRLVDAITGRVL